MKYASTGMKGLLAQPYQTLCSMWLVKRVDGTVLAFTDHDRDIDFSLEGFLIGAGISLTPWIVGTGTQTYRAASGYTATDIATSAALNVDNMEVHGVLVSPSISEADLNAGLWDFASVCVFMVNWADLEIDNPITSITRSGGIATATTPVAHQLVSGAAIAISGAVQSAYNIGPTVPITVTTRTKFTFPVVGTPATPATGTITYRTQFGAIIERIGNLGEVTIERGAFKAELRGLMQAYSRSIGEITSPSCRADLGDARCTVDLAPFTVTSTITGVNADGVTLYDTARSEPGPSGGIAVTTVTNANPGVVHLASAVPWPVGTPITIYGVVGPDLVNGDTIVRNPSANTFELGIDTSDTGIYPPYVSGGTVVQLGGTSGYFDYGLITFTSGLNAGLSMEVKSYAPGVIVLQLPFPYAVAPGDAYTMHAGCDKTLATCRDRFNNIVNMRAEPYLPGIDRLVQVGRHS